MSGVDGLEELLNKAKTYLDLRVYYKEIFDKQVYTDSQKLQRIVSLQLAEKSKWISERDVVEFFKNKIMVDHKQLIDLMKRQPFPEAFKWITDFKSQYQHWTKKLKKLLEK